MGNDFESYINEFAGWKLSGWNFDEFKDRWIEQPPTWDYREKIVESINSANSLLDMGTGGGEFLSRISNLPMTVCATESYKPNVPIAKERLEPLGISVYAIELDSRLPFSNNHFDTVINRHESFDSDEVFRILKPGGQFLTQQVGGKDNNKLNVLLAKNVKHEFHDWQLSSATLSLSNAGFEISQSFEEFPETTFIDIGAVIGYLKSIPWQIPDFSIEKYEASLRALHAQLTRGKKLIVNSHRFFIEARKPRN